MIGRLAQAVGLWRPRAPDVSEDRWDQSALATYAALAVPRPIVVSERELDVLVRNLGVACRARGRRWWEARHRRRKSDPDPLWVCPHCVDAEAVSELVAAHGRVRVVPAV